MTDKRKRMPAKYWGVWLLLFVVLETTAAVIFDGGTLSYWVQVFFQVREGELPFTLPRWVLIGVVLWLLLHFLRAFKK